MKNIDINVLVRDNVKAMKPYSSARDEFKNMEADLVFLDANENPFNTGFNRYPDPQQVKVKAILAEQKGVNPNQILLGNGSDEALDLLFRAFCEPNKDNVIAISPSYGMYQVLANLNAVTYKKSLLEPETFNLDVSDILSKVDENTKMIFLCSPNNPTGQLIPENQILEIVEKFNGLVVIDEAYIDFSSAESWNKKLELYNNIVVIQTLSKAYGLAAIRLGIVYANPEIIAVLNKIKPPYNINALTQQKAIEVVIDKNYTKNITNLNSEQKNVLFEALVQLNYVEKVYPTDANFILIKVDNANDRYAKILEKGFVVRNRTNDDLCENCLRISIGTPTENEKLIQVLKTL